MPRESALHRKLLGDRAEWDLTAILLRNVLHSLNGANWQRAGGKGSRPKPIDIPDGKQRKPAAQRGDEIARRLRNLNLIPAA